MATPNIAKKPLALSKFVIWFVAVPLIVCGILVLVVISAQRTLDADGGFDQLGALIGAALIQMAGLVAIVVILIAMSVVGLAYVLSRRSRIGRAYLATGFIVPAITVAALGTAAAGAIIRASDPDRTRYADNAELCNDIRTYSSDAASSSAGSAALDQDGVISDTRYLFADTNRSAFAPGSPCDEKRQAMTESELAQLQSLKSRLMTRDDQEADLHEQERRALARVHLQEIAALESAGRVQDAYDEATQYFKTAHISPGLACTIKDPNDCSIKWVDQGDGTEYTTQQYLAVFQG